MTAISGVTRNPDGSYNVARNDGTTMTAKMDKDGMLTFYQDGRILGVENPDGSLTIHDRMGRTTRVTAPKPKKKQRRVVKSGPLSGLIKGVAVLAKLSKLLFAAASAVIYTVVFSWKFAVVIMGLLFVHEMGHLLAMKHYGMKTKGIYMIPMVGAAAVSESNFPTRRIESIVALAGPATGFALALLAGGLYLATGAAFFAAVASFMCLVNLFNLLPIAPMDGGRVLKSAAMSLHSKAGAWSVLACMGVAAVGAVILHLWIFAIIIPFGLADLWVDRKQASAKPKLSKPGVALTVLSWVALAGGLYLTLRYSGHVHGADVAYKALTS